MTKDDVDNDDRCKCCKKNPIVDTPNFPDLCDECFNTYGNTLITLSDELDLKEDSKSKESYFNKEIERIRKEFGISAEEVRRDYHDRFDKIRRTM